MNMLSKLRKNSIITGQIESYCLACDCALRSEEDSYAHIYDLEHLDKLRAVPRLPDYNDCILKIKEGYFCWYCNVILQTVKRVSLHIVDSDHIDKKDSQSISRHANVILAFETVFIHDRSWNGLDGSTCSICNEDYDNEETHQLKSTHALKLIQKKCEFGETYVYRKVDDELFFCLICIEILPISVKAVHHECEKHVDNFEHSKQKASAIKNENIQSIEPINNSHTLPEANPTQIKDSKETNSKPKTQENKAQNACTNIDNNKPNKTVQNLPQEAAGLNTAAKNCKSDSLNESQEQNTQEVKLESQKKNTPAPTLKTEKDSVKPSSEASKPEIQIVKNTQELKDKPQLTLNTNSVTEDIQPKDSEAVKPKVETIKTEPKRQDDKVNGTAKDQTDNAEPYLYEYLKARNFIVKAHDNSVYCTLCDIRINESSTVHSNDKHHCSLYAKHIARIEYNKTTRLTKNETVNGLDNVTEQPSKTNQIKSKETVNNVSEKENVASVNLKTNKKGASQNTDKPSVVKENVVTINSKDTEKTTIPVQNQTQEAVTNLSEIPERKESKLTADAVKPPAIDQVNNKPQETINPSKDQEIKPKECILIEETIKTPENNNNVCEAIHGSSNEGNKEEVKQEPTETITQHKKGTKKAQKRATKAKVTKVEKPILTTESLPEVRGFRTGETATEEHNGLTEHNGSTNILKQCPNNEANILKDTQNVESLEVEETMAAKFATSADFKTNKLLEVLKTVSQVESAPEDVVINSKHVLGNLSFVLVVRLDDNAECVACDELLTMDDIHKHIATDGHRNNVEECLVVTSMKDEFIRQMKTEKYHCGFCNMVLPDWDAMKSHLETYRHCEAKTSAAWRLERYHPHLKHCETKEVRSILTTICRLTRE